MSRQSVMINQVKPQVGGRRSRWTALIQVVERSKIQQTRSGKTNEIRRYVFTHEEGTKVGAAIFDNDIRYFDDLLISCNRYWISNAFVNRVDENYKISVYPYSWFINNSTLVEPHDEPIPPSLPFNIDTATMSDIQKYADSDTSITFEALVIQVLPPKTQGKNNTTSRDIVVINQEYQTNKEEIIGMIEGQAYKNTDILLPRPLEQTISTINQALSLFNKKFYTAWVKVKTTLAPSQSAFWFATCNNCQKSINGDVGRNIKCISCNQNVKLEARTRILLELTDSTGTIMASVLATEAEKLIGVSAEALRTGEDQDIDLSTTIQNALKQHTIVAFLRKYDSTFQGRASEKYSIVISYLIQDLLMNETPQRKALPFEEITSEGHTEMTVPTPTAKRSIDSASPMEDINPSPQKKLEKLD
ncbi:OLC1v1009072C1 [Oldenlandia corymbosa var. corymbosa]|uniref:OLC1v1009072C1 n=1 Tax=Oldenlandia corymbosa var. corymbosa TaxID=529605 RepID=A0AAV1DN06_OLDCO|nr:OLC1v1009072C1 [Oldenlandia corymbosa var. corymbosa]